MTDLEKRFDQAMMDIYQRAKEECGYNATRFLRMLRDKGGLATAKTLLATSKPQYGLTKLWECGRLCLSVEAHVLKPEFTSLFTPEEQEVARTRLQQYGYKPQ